MLRVYWAMADVMARRLAGALVATASDPGGTCWTGSTPARQSRPQPAAETAGPAPVLPEHRPASQILTALADLQRPLRARDLCLALDLLIPPENTESIRSKLKRLASCGILAETEPGLFTQPRP